LINGGGYVTTTHFGLTISFHNAVMGFQLTRHTIIDHIDRDSLNCCKSNLRTADKQTQSINCRIGKNYRSGSVGVYHSMLNNTWVAKWTSEEGDICKKLYSVRKYGFEPARQLVIDHRSMVERHLLHYMIALHPADGQQVIDQMYNADDDDEEDNNDEDNQ